MGGEDQVHAEASTDLSHADELAHKIRLFLFELGELVDHDNEVRDRHGGLSALVKLGVKINIVYAVFAENALTAQVFAFYRDHGSADLIAREVGDLTCHVRKV